MSSRAALLGACVAASACTLLTPLDDLTNGGGAPSRPAPEGGGGGDAALDAPSDAPSDAGAPSLGCAALSPAPSLCEDFDGTSPLGAPWSKETRGASSSVGVSSTRSLSRPSSLIASIGDGNAERYAVFERALAGAPKRVRLSYALWIEAPPATGEIEVNDLRFLPANGSVYVDFYLAITKNGARYVQQEIASGVVDNVDVPLMRAIPLRTWTQVTLEITLVAAPSLTVTIDGVTAATAALVYPPGPIAATQVTAGITYASNVTSGADIALDDFVVDVTP